MFLLVLAYPDSSGPKAIKRLCVCVCYYQNSSRDVSVVRLMHSDAEGNWVTDISLPSGKKRFLYVNICRPVLPVSCRCTSECDHNAGMCATDVTDGTVISCLSV